VDAVVVVRASSVDEARAQLALLTLPATPGVAHGGPESVASGGEGAGRVLGSFVAELTPEAYATLTAVRPEADERQDHPRAATDGSGGPGEPASPDEPAAPDASGAREKAAARESARLGAAATPRAGAATEPPPAGADGRNGTRGAPSGGAPSAKPGEPGAARGAAKKASPEPGTDPAASPPATPAVPPPASPPAAPRKGDAPPSAAPRPTDDRLPAADELAKLDGASEDDAPVVRRVRIVVVPR